MRNHIAQIVRRGRNWRQKRLLGARVCDFETPEHLRCALAVAITEMERAEEERDRWKQRANRGF